jgi:hypothetical protein
MPPRRLNPAGEPARIVDPAVAILIFAVVAVAFRSLSSGGFFVDDFVRLYDLANYGLAKLILTPHGGHLYTASNGVYAVFWHAFGLAPHRWLAAVTALHALNAAIFFGVLRRFGCGTLAAGTMAGLWALCPVQAGAVGWMAVFGHVLLGTIMLVWLNEVAGIATGVAPSGWKLARCWTLGVLAAMSFAIGIGLSMVLPIAASLMLPAGAARRRVMLVFASLWAIVPTIYVVQHALYARLYTVPPFMVPGMTLPSDIGDLVRRAGQIGRLVLDFLVYGAGVLSLGWLAMPGRLAGTVVEPDVVLSCLYLPAVLLAGLVGWVLSQAPPRRRSLAAGFLLLAITAYGSVAFGAGVSARVESEARVLGWTTARAIADIVTIPRYHYVATLFLSGMLAVTAEAAASRSAGWSRATRAVLIVVLVFLAVRARRDTDVVAALRAWDVFSSATRQLTDDVARWTGGDTVYLPNDAIGSGYLALHADYFPGRAALCVVTHPTGVVGGKTVRFIESDPRLLAVLRAQNGTPIARLVVAPDEVFRLGGPVQP